MRPALNTPRRPGGDDRPSDPCRRHAAAPALVGVAAAALLASGCTPTGDAPARDRRSTGGPLEALTGPGGQSIRRPPARLLGADDTWKATFGFVVCTSGSPVTIQGVRLEGSEVPDSSATLRSVAAGEEWSIPHSSALGSPPAWQEPYADGTGITGSYADLGDAEVTQTCATFPSREESYQQLMVTLEATPDGSAASSFHVDYAAGSEEYTIEVPWEMLLCGTRSDPEICSQ